jgi:Ca-activated chloride channel family protein
VVSFADPGRLWLLVLPAVAAVAALWRHTVRRRDQRQLASPSVWLRVMGGTPATGLVRLLAWVAAATCLVLALARPQWGEVQEERSVRSRDLVVAVDVSDSMRCADIRPSRLVRSLEVLSRALPELEGNRVGVLVFAGDAYPLVPLTTDLEAVATFLDGVEPGMVGLPGSNLERAVNGAVDLLPDEGEGRVLVLVTDGENLQGDVDAAKQRLADAGVGLIAMVAGTEPGGPIQMTGDDGRVHYKRDGSGETVITRARPEVMAGLARDTEGEVLSVGDRDAARELASAVERLRTREVASTHRVERVERFPVFLALAMLGLVVGFAASPWRRLTAVAAVVVLLAAGTTGAQPASGAAAPAARGAPAATTAGGTSAQAPPNAAEAPIPWWQRLIPGGSRRLARKGVTQYNAGKPAAAASDFAGAARLAPGNPTRLFDLGTALAAGGQVDAASGPLSEAEKSGVPGAAYNLGTAALAEGQAEPAVRWLRSALLANPDDPDVKRNYELALKLKEQQERQQQQQQDRQPTPAPTPTAGQPTPSPGSATPTPSAGGVAEPTPTPTPDPRNALYSALERAEAEARQKMQRPTPQPVKVEKDW